MPAFPLKLQPGINLEATPLLNETSWSQSQLIRWFQGYLQKLGGWLRLTSQTFVGTCRGMLAWSDLTGVGYIAVGTEQRLEVYNAGSIYDITPIEKTDNVGTPFSTTITSAVITVHDAAHAASVGDWVNVVTPTAIDGLVLQGLYQVTSIIDANHYTFNAAAAATSTVSNDGVTALFTVTNGSPTVTVTLNNHGLSLGSVYTVYVSTTVATVILFGSYIVQTVIDANNFTITGAPAANANTSAHENGGNVRIQYLLPSGLVNPATATGYGEGGYGIGPYGYGGMSGAPTPIRQWTMAAWGKQLLACPTGGTIYFWDPTAGFFENPAAVVMNAPAANTGIFISMPYQQVVAYGITDPNTSNPDPMLIGWSDVGNYTVWTAGPTNQAGKFRLPRGSKIVAGIQGPQYGMFWTDLGFWLMQYINFPLVYGFQEIAQGCGLIAMRAQCVLGGAVYWMSLNQFYIFNGTAVVSLPCAVWDILFYNCNFNNQDKIQMGANSHFNEFFVFYPSLNGNGENDSYIKFNATVNAWDYGSIIRTAWFDQNDVLSNNPIGTDTNGLIQQHESGNNADNVPMQSSATTGWFKISEGALYIFIERMIPDFIMNGSNTVQITVFMAQYPDSDIVNQYGPYNWQTGTNTDDFFIVRGRGRLAKVQISSTDVGSFWRLGQMLYFGSPAGKR